MKSCTCEGWQKAVENRSPYQKNGGLAVGFMMADPVRPYMQYEGAGDIKYCPWCGYGENYTKLRQWLNDMQYEDIETVYHDLTYKELLWMMDLSRKYFRDRG